MVCIFRFVHHPPLTFMFIPDKPEKALHSIARVHGMTLTEARDHPLPNKALAEIQRSVEFERSYTGATGWMDCFRPSNKVLYRTILGMTLQAIQQLTGANYFFYYGSTIFESVGIQDSDVTEIILGTVNFVCTFGGIYIMEHVSHHSRWIVVTSSY